MKSMMNKAMLTTLVGLALSGSAVSLAADVQDTVYDFGEAITTASRMAEKKIDVPADTTVITAENIEKGNYANVSDALKANDIPVVQHGFGAYPEINGDTRVMVLVNGRKMNWEHLVMSGDNNAIDINQIPMENVERIEVVKGPNSALYGSRAVAGVINIITKEPEEGNKTTVRAEYGTWKARKGSIITQGGDANDRYMLTYSKEKRNSYNYKDKNGNTHVFPSSEIDHDDVTLRYDHNYSDDRLTFDITRSEKKDGYGIYLMDPFKGQSYGDGEKIRNIDVSYGVTYTFGALTEGEGTYIRAYRNTEKSDSVFGSNGSWYFHNLSLDVVEGQKTWFLGDHTVVAGVAHHDEHINETNDDKSTNKKAVTQAFYVEDKWNLGHEWSLNYGTRYEHHNVFGGDWTSHVGINKKLSDDTHVYLSWGQAVNNPTLKMLYANTKYWKGNPDLKPEKSYTTTLGIDSKVNDKLSVSASVYDSHLKDAQTWVGGYKDEQLKEYVKGYYENINKEKRRGLNLSATYKIDDAWKVRGAYHYSQIRQDDGKGGGYKNWPNNRQPNAYSMEVSYDKNRWSVSSQFNYITGRSTSQYSASSYFTWDMNVNYRLNQNTKFYVKGYNLTNRSYETVPYTEFGTNKVIPAYAMPERHFVIGMEHSF